jgi:peroxiredoxin
MQQCGTFGEKITLSNFKGKKNVILVFYPGDNTPICTNQLGFYNEILDIFESYNATVLGINDESIESHKSFAKALGLDYPLLSDETKEMLRTYQVFNEKDKSTLRAIYVIDKFGIVQWSYLSPIDTNPGADGILKVLEKIKAI